MFELTDNMRFYVSASPVSMRYGIRGLTNKVMSWPGMSPMSGDCFIFFSADRHQVKLLRWDGDGFLLYQKRLVKGRFRVPEYDPLQGCCSIAWDDLYFFDEGAHRSGHKTRQTLRERQMKTYKYGNQRNDL